ncbi:MAG: TonB-dependent receptor [Candidatus Sulfopaludibacter sp.]|nr:TonB-dependent receptor [Candidatus Sulfopaludibacter sp.]
MNGCLRSHLFFLPAFLLCAGALWSQTPTAVITGNVVDATGGSVPDAKVTVVNQGTNVTSSRNTSADGAFTIINLLPGNYVLTVEKGGFKKAALPVFKLDVNQTLTEKITLEVGATSETVTVSAESVAVMVQRASTELGTTIDETMVHELPLNGRNFTQLLILQPGVNPVDTSQGNSAGKTGAGGNPDGGNISIPGSIVYKASVNGAGNRSNAYYMDGIINTDDRGGGWAIPPIADTIQEFKVQSHNNDAQYGNVLGSVVNIVTKSGTNQYHGSAWEFARSQIFDARNPFTGFCSPASCPTLSNKLAGDVAAGSQTSAGASAILSGTPVAPLGYTQNEYGGTFGGPIIHNKTFFYVAYEGWRFSQPQNSYANIPTPLELSGDFSQSLIGSVNAAKTVLTPNPIFNPFAESGPNSSVPFRCDSSGNPMPLLTPGLGFGTPGYGIQATGGSPCNRIPSALIDAKLASVISAYTAPQYKNCQFTPNLTFAIDNCLDSRTSNNNANNFDFRVDHHFSEKNIVFGRAYMMWDTNNGIVAGTTSITPSPFHTWNIGGAWDHIFTPNLILELRGGINARPVMVNPTNPNGYNPETAAGFSNLDATAGFFLNVGGYIGSANSGIGNVGPQHRANPEHNFSGAMTWTHGNHTVRFGGEYLYENRLEINTYETFTSSTAQTCPTNASGLFSCGTNQGNALASMLLDLPSGLTVNVPQYEEVHVRMAPVGFFVQDEWHVRSNLTINVGLRYDYDPAVKILTSNGETVNALNLPGQQFIIGAAQSSAYTSGCSSSQLPPCVPGGLSATNPAFNVTVGGVTYNTLNNIAFSPNQPALKAISDNIGPRIGLAWTFMNNTVLRAGYGIFYDPIAYRSQYAENTLQGSIWPWTRGVSDTLNTAPMGTSPTPTVAPICTSLTSCGPYGGYGTSQLTGLAGSNPIVVAPTPWGSTFGGYTNDPNYSDPRSQQWNIQIEHQLSPTSMFSIAYVGSHTQRLEWCCKANYPQGGPYCENNPAQGFTCPTAPLTQAQITQHEYMPFASQGWNYSESTGFSTFHALEAQFQKRFSHGLETLAAFTFEKCLGDSNGDFNAENGAEAAPYQYFFNAHLSKGVCTYDIPKVLTLTAVYELPFGTGKRWLKKGVLSRVLGNWETNYAFLARSGQAFNPSWGGASSICASPTATGCVPTTIAGVAPLSTDPANLSDAAGSITGYSRPSILPGCQIAVAHQSVSSWYNPACFVSPASLSVGPGYGFGDSPIGFLRTMRWINLDVVLAKSIAITETKSLQFRAEAFNVANHMVLGAPGTSIAPSYSNGGISYGSAGVVSSIANIPRSLQVAVKFMF